MNPDEFAGKRALITGGTGGIGAAIAKALNSVDCQVIATGVSQREVNDFESSVSGIAATVLDVTDGDAITNLVNQIDQLDILVNCAGIILRDGTEFDDAGFQKVIDVNLTGTMRVCTACRPQLNSSRGCILNIASMLTFFGSGVAPGYSASKGGVAQLTKSLAIAWADEGIRVNAIAPGWIETDLTRKLVDDRTRSASIVNRTPMRRWGLPDDVTGAALFLCSSAASFITGVVLPVDGGYSVA